MLNFFQPTGDFFSFAGREPWLYCFPRRCKWMHRHGSNLNTGGHTMKMSRKYDRFDALTQAAALFSVLACGCAFADDAEPVYTMTVIVDAAHGSKVAAGKYERAIEMITATKRTSDPYSEQTNLCVAYTKTGDLENAARACESAVDLVRDEPAGRRGVLAAPRARTQRVYLALALSNLGVLHVARGTPDVARENFREALALEAGLSAPKINLERLTRS